MTGEETAAVVGTAATAGERTAAAAAGAPKVFREGAIIAAGEETATVAARASRRGGAAGFNGGEKYIWINGNAVAFAWGGGGGRDGAG